MRWLLYFFVVFVCFHTVANASEPEPTLVYKKIAKGEASPMEGYVINQQGLAYLIMRIETADSVCEVSKKKIVETCQAALDTQKEKYELVIKDLTLPPVEVYCPKCQPPKKAKNFFWEGVAIGTGVTILVGVIGYLSFSLVR